MPSLASVGPPSLECTSQIRLFEKRDSVQCAFSESDARFYPCEVPDGSLTLGSPLVYILRVMELSTERIRFCVSRDGTRIAYAKSGTGPTLIWLQDWVHHIKFDAETPLWRPWLAVLSRRRTLVRYDFRGSGLSDRDGIEFSHERHVEDLEAVINAAGMQRVSVVAMAGGGAKAVSYAVRHPDRVVRLVLLGPPSRGRLAGIPSQRLLEESEVRLNAIRLGWTSEAGLPSEIRAYSHFLARLQIPDASPDLIRSFNDLLRRAISPANAIELLRGYWRVDVTSVLSQISCPTLVLHVREDSTIPFEEGRKVAALIPGADFVPLESRNHILLENEPAWIHFVAALDAFLSESPRIGLGGEGQIPGDLTARERTVLEFIAAGLDNREISTELGISEKTVRNHVSAVLRKLGAKSRAQAVARARDAGYGQRAVR